MCSRGGNQAKAEKELIALATKVKGDKGEGSLAYALAANNLAVHLLKMKPDSSTTDRDKEALRLLRHAFERAGGAQRRRALSHTRSA